MNVVITMQTTKGKVPRNYIEHSTRYIQTFKKLIRNHTNNFFMNEIRTQQVLEYKEKLKKKKSHTNNGENK